MGKIFFISTFLLILLNSSCTVFHYPPPLNVPGFEKKGDLHLNIGSSLYVFDPNYSLYLQSAYAFTDLHAIGGTINYLPELRHIFGEVMLGQYRAINDWRMSVWAGYGNAYFDRPEPGRYHRYFLQGNMIYKRKILELGLIPRIGFSQPYNFRNASHNWEEPVTTWELGGHFAIGYGSVKYFSQAFFSFAPNKEFQEFHSPFSFSGGFKLQFPLEQSNTRDRTPGL